MNIQLRKILLTFSMMTVTACSFQSQALLFSANKFFEDKKVAKLCKAARKGRLKTIEKLLGSGVDINAKGLDGVTPLLCALYGKNLAGLESLLQHGADPNIITTKGVSTMEVASLGDSPELLELVLQYGGNPNLISGGSLEKPMLSGAVGQRRLDNVKLLLKAGANINGQDKRKYTAVTYSVTRGFFEITFYLLQQGADYSIRNKFKHNVISDLEFRRLERHFFHSTPERHQWMLKVIDWLLAQGEEIKYLENLPETKYKNLQ